MHAADKQATEQVKATPNQQNGQPRQATQPPSTGTNPIPAPIVATAAKVVAQRNQQQFDQLVIANLVAGFLGSNFTEMGAIADSIIEEAVLQLPLTVSEFQQVQQIALPPSK